MSALNLASVWFPVAGTKEHEVEPARLPLREARRVVVKVGTAVVSNSDGTLALSRMGALVEQVSCWYIMRARATT